jgi:hypothetical protein
MPEGSLGSPDTRWAPYQAVHTGRWTVMPAPDEGTARLVVRPAVGERVCRCGTHLSPGRRVLEVEGLPPEVAGFLVGRTFCSPRCVRADFMELLTSIDRLETPTAGRTVEDLGAAFATLAFVLGQILSTPT